MTLDSPDGNDMLQAQPVRYGLQIIAGAIFTLLAAADAGAIDYGTPVPDDKYPAVGMIVVKVGEQQSTLGTGTLIRPNIVITAAHVIQDAPTPGHISFTAGQGGQTFQAQALVYRTHPGYINLRSDSLVLEDERTFMDTDMLAASSSDLALLLLNKSVPASFALPPLITKNPEPGNNVTVIGFGQDEAKKGGKPRKLQGTLQFLKRYEEALLFRTPKGSSQRTDHGDSGGPLLLDQNGQQQLAAITHGFYTAIKVDGLSPDEYGIYVSIADHLPWINHTADQLTQYKAPPGPAFYLTRANRRTPFLALTARQIFSLARADTPVERLVGRAFQRGLNEPIPEEIASGWQKRFQLPPGMLVPIKPAP